MAKFCGNCGTQLDDNAKICGKCGAPLDGVSAGIPDLKIEDPEKVKKRRKVMKRAVMVIALVLVAAIVLQVVPQYTGYRGLLRKVMRAYESYDIDTLLSLSSDVYYYVEDDGVEYYLENTVGNHLDAFESSVGHNYKLAYEINEAYVMSERKEEEVRNEIQNTYPEFDISQIKKIVVVDLALTAKQEGKSDTINMNVMMAKENGTWKLLYIE